MTIIILYIRRARLHQRDEPSRYFADRLQSRHRAAPRGGSVHFDLGQRGTPIPGYLLHVGAVPQPASRFLPTLAANGSSPSPLAAIFGAMRSGGSGVA